MEFAITIAQLISVLAFFPYGLACFFSKELTLEFERYRLLKFIKLVGFLEVLGSLGLMAGFVYTPLTFFAASGLTILMASAIVVRIRIKDSFFQMAPALILLCLNLFILYQTRSYIDFLF